MPKNSVAGQGESKKSAGGRTYLVILRLAKRAEGPLKCNARFRQEQAQFAGARFLAVCAARNDTAFRVDRRRVFAFESDAAIASVKCSVSGRPRRHPYLRLLVNTAPL